MEIPIKVKMTKMPNFLLLEDTELTVPVGQLTREQATQYANTMRDTFIAHWEDRQSRVSR